MFMGGSGLEMQQMTGHPLGGVALKAWHVSSMISGLRLMYGSKSHGDTYAIRTEEHICNYSGCPHGGEGDGDVNRTQGCIQLDSKSGEIRYAQNCCGAIKEALTWK